MRVRKVTAAILSAVLSISGLAAMTGVTAAAAEPAAIIADGNATNADQGNRTNGDKAIINQTDGGTRAALARATESALDKAANAYVIPPVLRSGDALPAPADGTTVALSAKGATIANDTVTIDATDKVTATITAAIGVDGQNGTVTKEFTVTVLPATARKLLGYQRTPYEGADGPLKGNDGSSAYSLHLALDGDGAAANAWTPLNKNYGIMFSRTYSARKDTSTGLINPNVFLRKDGSYGVVATRTGFQYNQATGTPDPSAKTSVIIATTKDFQTFEQAKNDNVVNVGETNGVNHPYAVYDSSADRYVVGWTDDAGTAKYTTFADLADAKSAHGDVIEGTVPQTGAIAAANGVDDYVPGYAVPIDGTLADALAKRFGRVTNTGHEKFADVTIKQNASLDAATLPTDVTLDYSDGSTGTLPVDWDTSAVNTSTSGTYTVTGTVRQTNYDPKAEGKDYTVPFAEDRADPDLYKYERKQIVDGKETTRTSYLFAATNDTNGDCRLLPNGEGNYLAIRSGDSIEALADAANDPGRTLSGTTGGNQLEHVLLQPGQQIELGDSGKMYEMEGSFWAPEIHRIGGRLSILFAVNSTANGTDDSNTWSAIMQLRQDADGHDLDPTVAANWDTPHIITYSDGSTWMGSYCDMTFLRNKAGQAYYMWAGFAISPIDESAPWKIKAASNKNDQNLVELPGKDYAWEAGGAYEGQYVVEHDGRYYVTYSARRVDGRYTLGYQSAAVDADLMDPASWSKPMTPTLFSSQVDGEWQSGPGHAAFAEGPDGELLFVYHTYSHVTRADGFNGGKKGDGTGDAVKKTNGRDAYIRRVHWGANNRLILDMTPSEELSDANRTVTMNVVVTKDGTEGGEGGDQPAFDPNKTTDYLFAYFTGGETKSTDEQIYFATSQDGTTWTDLTEDGKPVVASDQYDKGLRDPFLLRGHDGGYYLLATDLSIYERRQNGSTNPWKDAVTPGDGSTRLAVYHSNDLVHWNVTYPDVASKTNGGCAWAPEAFWDDAKQQYVVYFAVGSDPSEQFNKSDATNMYYVTTKDFQTFSDPVKWIDFSAPALDITVTKVGDWYYRSMSTKAGSRNRDGVISLERSKDFYSVTTGTNYASADKTGSWEALTSADQIFGAGYKSKMEGPELFEYNEDDWIKDANGKAVPTWGLMADYIRDGGKGYQPFRTTDLSNTVPAGQEGSTWSKGDDIDFDKLLKRHGTILPLTRAEYVRVTKAYHGSVPAIPGSGALAVTARPTKTAYTVGDAFDASGLEITLTDAVTGKARVLGADEYTLAGFDSSKASDAVTVTATLNLDPQQTVSFTVSVKAKEEPKPTPSSDASLKSLTVAGVKVSVADAEAGKASVEVADPAKVGVAEVKAVVAEKASVKVAVKDAVVTVTVTAEDGTTVKTYTVKLTKKAETKPTPKPETKPEECKPLTFSDVTSKTPHAADIKWLACEGIAKGYEDGSFGGMRTVVRQDMAAFLYRLAGSPEFDADKALAERPFTDVTEDTPHYREILWLHSTGIAEGYRNADGSFSFGGMRTVVRQDMAAFLHRFAQYEKADPSLGEGVDFTDVDGRTPHAEDIVWLARTGVAQGFPDGSFGGMRDVVRQDMAAFLHRMDTNVLTK